MATGYGNGSFGLGTSAAFGGAFNSIPDWVGSAPAQDISSVRSENVNDYVLEIWNFCLRLTTE